MEQQNYNNSGSLFVNDRKASGSHPDYKGSVTINGQKYWLSGWLKTKDKRDGTGKLSYISIKAEPAEESAQAPESRPVFGFPTPGGMQPTQQPARYSATPQYPTAPTQSQRSAPAPAPGPAENPGEDLPF